MIISKNIINNETGIIICFYILFTSCHSHQSHQDKIQNGAEQSKEHFHLLRNKRVALVTNHSALKGNLNLLDF